MFSLIIFSLAIISSMPHTAHPMTAEEIEDTLTRQNISVLKMLTFLNQEGPEQRATRQAQCTVTVFPEGKVVVLPPQPIRYLSDYSHSNSIKDSPEYLSQVAEHRELLTIITELRAQKAAGTTELAPIFPEI